MPEADLSMRSRATSNASQSQNVAPVIAKVYQIEQAGSFSNAVGQALTAGHQSKDKTAKGALHMHQPTQSFSILASRSLQYSASSAAVQRLQHAVSRMATVAENSASDGYPPSKASSVSPKHQRDESWAPLVVAFQQACGQRHGVRGGQALHAHKCSATQQLDQFQARMNAAAAESLALVQQQAELQAKAADAASASGSAERSTALQAQADALGDAAAAYRKTAHQHQSSAAALCELLAALKRAGSDGGGESENNGSGEDADSSDSDGKQDQAAALAVLQAAPGDIARVCDQAMLAVQKVRAAQQAVREQLAQSTQALQQSTRLQEEAQRLQAAGKTDEAVSKWRQAACFTPAPDACQPAESAHGTIKQALATVAAAKQQLEEMHRLRKQLLEAHLQDADSSAQSWQQAVAIARRLVADMQALAAEKQAAADAASKQARDAASRAMQLRAMHNEQGAAECDKLQQQWQSMADKLTAEATDARSQASLQEQSASGAELQLRKAQADAGDLHSACASMELEHAASLLQLDQACSAAVGDWQLHHIQSTGQAHAHSQQLQNVLTKLRAIHTAAAGHSSDAQDAAVKHAVQEAEERLAHSQHSLAQHQTWTSETAQVCSIAAHKRIAILSHHCFPRGATYIQTHAASTLPLHAKL